MLATMPKKARRKSAKSQRVSKSKHPLLPQVKALVNPFDSTPGVAKHLVDPMPSQSYKLKSRGTFTVGNGQNLILCVAPCFASDATWGFPSVYGISGAGSQLSVTILKDGTQAGTAPVKGTATYGSIIPTRPYSYSTPGMQFRLVSYGIRIRYTGSALNANGTIKCLPNPHGGLIIDNGTTWQNLLTAVDGNAHTILRSVYNNAVYDFSAIGDSEWLTNGMQVCSAILDEGGGGVGTTQAGIGDYHSSYAIGQDSSSVEVGQPGMYITYLNNTTANVQFEVELVENFECKGSTNAAFHTDSHGNPELHAEVMRTVISGHMHAAASSTPNIAKSLKAVNQASKSPLGKAVIAAALA